MSTFRLLQKCELMCDNPGTGFNAQQLRCWPAGVTAPGDEMEQSGAGSLGMTFTPQNNQHLNPGFCVGLILF